MFQGSLACGCRLMKRASPPDESRVDTQPHHKELQTSLEMKCQEMVAFIQKGARQTPLPRLQLGPLGAESRKPTLDPHPPLPSKGSWWLTRWYRWLPRDTVPRTIVLIIHSQFPEKYLSQTYLFSPPLFVFNNSVGFCVFTRL